LTRLTREQLFTPDEQAIVHVMNRTVRRCYLMGQDELTGRNYDYRKDWIEQRIEHLAQFFGIDVLCYSIMSNHFHLVLRQRPDIVQSWDDTEVARRWLMLCPKKKNRDGTPKPITETDLNSIRNDPDKVKQYRSRLSDISWWMRLLCQTIAQRINRDDNQEGKVWQNRFKAVRLLDEASLLACAAYVDLNPIRAAMAQTLEQSDFTSIQRRIQALKEELETEYLGAPITTAAKVAVGDSTSTPTVTKGKRPDRALAPVHLNELRDALQMLPCRTGNRCSDRGFLNMTASEYVELLDWTARLIVPGKRGSTPMDTPPVFERLQLGMATSTWGELVRNFGRLFRIVAGKPHVVDSHRGVRRPKRFRLTAQARQLLGV
jgi:REP element-mobilizing transposase RayT